MRGGEVGEATGKGAVNPGARSPPQPPQPSLPHDPRERMGRGQATPAGHRVKGPAPPALAAAPVRPVLRGAPAHHPLPACCAPHATQARPAAVPALLQFPQKPWRAKAAGTARLRGGPSERTFPRRDWRLCRSGVAAAAACTRQEQVTLPAGGAAADRAPALPADSPHRQPTAPIPALGGPMAPRPAACGPSLRMPTLQTAHRQQPTAPVPARGAYGAASSRPWTAPASADPADAPAAVCVSARSRPTGPRRAPAGAPAAPAHAARA